jgi:hypothetical protein
VDPLAKAMDDANTAIFQLIVCNNPLKTMENIPRGRGILIDSIENESTYRPGRGKTQDMNPCHS